MCFSLRSSATQCEIEALPQHPKMFKFTTDAVTYPVGIPLEKLAVPQDFVLHEGILP